MSDKDYSSNKYQESPSVDTRAGFGVSPSDGKKLGQQVGKKISQFPFTHLILMVFVVFLLVDCNITDIFCNLDSTVKLCIFAFAYIIIFVSTKFL